MPKIARGRASTRVCAVGDQIYGRYHTADLALRRMRELGVHWFEIGSLRLVVLAGVWSPAIDWSGRRAVLLFPDLTGQSFLDLGSGCGIGCAMAIANGAERVVAVDVNPLARRNTLLNIRSAIKQTQRKNISFYINENIQMLKETFDFIYFNPPFHSDRAKNMLERAVSDYRYEWLDEVFRALPRLMNPVGRMIAVFSISGDQSRFERRLSAANFRTIEKISEVSEGYECTFYRLEFVG